MILVKLSEVVQCEGVGAYNIFHLQDRRQIIVTRNLKKIELQFQDRGFFRVHHRHLVNISYVAEVNSKSNFLLFRNGDMVNISLRKKAAFMKALRNLH